jgi:hypothetical protein
MMRLRRGIDLIFIAKALMQNWLMIAFVYIHYLHRNIVQARPRGITSPITNAQRQNFSNNQDLAYHALHHPPLRCENVRYYVDPCQLWCQCHQPLQRDRWICCGACGKGHDCNWDASVLATGDFNV